MQQKKILISTKVNKKICVLREKITYYCFWKQQEYMIELNGKKIKSLHWSSSIQILIATLFNYMHDFLDDEICIETNFGKNLKCKKYCIESFEETLTELLLYSMTTITSPVQNKVEGSRYKIYD